MRKAFFSFEYSDAWRVQNVINSPKVGSSTQGHGFLAPQKWEEVKRKGDNAIKQWIYEQMYGTSVTVVLVGEKTAGSRWVRYEIEKTIENKKGLLAIYIHGIKDQQGNFSRLGNNPLANYSMNVSMFSSLAGFLARKNYSTYDWADDDGRENIGDWIEEAKQQSEAAG